LNAKPQGTFQRLLPEIPEIASRLLPEIPENAFGKQSMEEHGLVCFSTLKPAGLSVL
jgi:hypothetical protein